MTITAQCRNFKANLGDTVRVEDNGDGYFEGPVLERSVKKDKPLFWIIPRERVTYQVRLEGRYNRHGQLIVEGNAIDSYDESDLQVVRSNRKYLTV